MTADAFADAIQRGREAGMDEYLVKPLDVPRLYRVLRSFLKESASEAPPGSGR